MTCMYGCLRKNKTNSYPGRGNGTWNLKDKMERDFSLYTFYSTVFKFLELT